MICGCRGAPRINDVVLTPAALPHLVSAVIHYANTQLLCHVTVIFTR